MIDKQNHNTHKIFQRIIKEFPAQSQLEKIGTVPNAGNDYFSRNDRISRREI
jgi:hypothetical protein